MAITGPFQSSRHWCFVMIENVDKRFDGRTNLAEPYGVIAKNNKEVALGHHPSNKLTAKNGDKAPLVSWEPYFCVLLQDEQTFTAYRSEEMAVGDMVFSDTPRVRLDSGGRQFRRRWGYDGSASGCGGGTGPGSLNGGAGHLEDIEEDGDDFSDTYSLRDETSYNSILHEVAVDDANTKTSPPTSPTKLPVGVVLGSSPERAVDRLRHTFSLGLTDRSKLRSSGGSLTSGTDELAAKNSTHALSPENVRKRFSAGSGGKRTSSTLRLDSPTEIQEETFELPAIITTAPSGQSRYDSAHFLDRVNEPAARCRGFQEDTDSLQSGKPSSNRLVYTFGERT
ncbi:Ras GTPase-activating-like protein [Daphnia magna]|uniref:Ras GTPase-activating-like protein n=1 Tax=Daphnia magna TaxID=35525 RepID=A0A162PS46_9CRUS|nr:Ras GTPase-activating-like protein [Daphnia magna]